MSEKNKYLKDQFERGKQLGEDKSISAGDAVRQIMGEARAEFQAASIYTKMRSERKQNVAKRLQETRKKCGLTQQELAAKIGISEGQLSQKLAGRYAFKQSEMIAICRVLALDLSAIPEIFFCPKS